MPANDLLKRARDLLGFELSELAGATFGGEIPIPESLANRLIAQRLPALNIPIADAKLHALDGDALEAQITVRGSSLIPMIKLHLQIERQPQPHDPVLLLRWSMPGMGPLAMFAGPVIAHFKRLPAGVRMEGEHVAVDIRELLTTRGMADLLDYLTDLQLHTRAGAFLFRIGTRVPPPRITPPQR